MNVDADDDDEVLPLLGDAHARRHVERSFNPRTLRSLCSRGLPWVIVLFVLQVVLIRAETALQFPYLRSLQWCDVPTSYLGFAREWSGSDHCGDRAVVTRLAQAEVNYVQGVGMVVHCVFLPLLGWFADRFGRKPLVVLSFVGLLFETALNALVQRVDVLFFAVAVQMGTNGLTPALLAMIADGTPADERVSAYVLCMACAVPAYTGVYVGITHFVLAQHLHMYQHTWASLAALALLGLVVACLTPETLRRDAGPPPTDGNAPRAIEAVEAAQVASWGAADDDAEAGYSPAGGATAVGRGGGGAAAADAAKAPPHTRETVRVCSPLRLLTRCCGGARGKAPGDHGSGSGEQSAASPCAPCAVPPLRFVMLLCAPLLVALCAFSTLDGFALIAYSWEQETMYYVRLCALPSGGMAILASIYLMRDPALGRGGIGPLRTIQLGLVCLNVSLLVACLAQWHTSLLLLALMLCACVGLGVLPVLRLLSASVAPAQQAAGNAAVLAVATGARACGLALHAVVFKEAASRGVLNATFVLGSAFALLALLVTVVLPPPPEAWRVAPGGRGSAPAAGGGAAEVDHHREALARRRDE